MFVSFDAAQSSERLPLEGVSPPTRKSAVPAQPGPHWADQQSVQPVACDEWSKSIGLGRTRSCATEGAGPQKLDGAPSRRQSWQRARQNAAGPGTRGPPHSFCPAGSTTYRHDPMPHPAHVSRRSSVWALVAISE